MDDSTCAIGEIASAKPYRLHGSMPAWKDGCRGEHCTAAYEEWLDKKHPTMAVKCARCSKVFQAAASRTVCSPCRATANSINVYRSEASRVFNEGGNSGLADYLLRLAHEVTGIAGCRKLNLPGRSGYPEVTVGGKSTKAHRIVAKHIFGDIRGSEVHHKCAQRSCINPDHLQLVSRSQNRAEMLLRNQYIRYIRKLSDRLEELDHNDALAARAREFLREQDWRD